MDPKKWRWMRQDMRVSRPILREIGLGGALVASRIRISPPGFQDDAEVRRERGGDLIVVGAAGLRFGLVCRRRSRPPLTGSGSRSPPGQARRDAGGFFAVGGVGAGGRRRRSPRRGSEVSFGRFTRCPDECRGSALRLNKSSWLPGLLSLFFAVVADRFVAS